MLHSRESRPSLTPNPMPSPCVPSPTRPSAVRQVLPHSQMLRLRPSQYFLPSLHVWMNAACCNCAHLFRLVRLMSWAQPLGVRGGPGPPKQKMDGPPTFYVAFWWGSPKWVYLSKLFFWRRAVIPHQTNKLDPPTLKTWLMCSERMAKMCFAPAPWPCSIFPPAAQELLIVSQQRRQQQQP